MLKQAVKVEFRQEIPMGTLEEVLPHVNQYFQCFVVPSCPRSSAAAYFCITKIRTITITLNLDASTQFILKISLAVKLPNSTGTHPSVLSF